jgi:hypothetical protein
VHIKMLIEQEEFEQAQMENKKENREQNGNSNNKEHNRDYG